MVRDIELSLLTLRLDARKVDATKVPAIANSIKEIGLINPIRVRAMPEGDGFEVIAGAHRLDAYKYLGRSEIAAFVVEDNDLTAELAMIDENLCRAELSPVDRAQSMARRKAIYQQLHPETAGQVAGGIGRHSATDKLSTAAFADDTAGMTGQTSRNVRREAERGEKVIAEVMDMIRDTPLNSGTFLDSIKNLPPNDQVTVAKRQLAHLKREEKERRNGPINGARAAAAGRQEPSNSLDYFPTPPWATRALLEVVLPHMGIDPLAIGAAWEPACGEGHISGVLAEYADRVVASDIHSYHVKGRYPPGWEGLSDFLASPTLIPEGVNEAGPWAGWIITNPPFEEKALAFALQALKLAQTGVAIFIQTRWLEGLGRYEQLFKDMPPTIHAQFVERVPLCKGKWDPEGNTATAYAWLVWVKDAPRLPTFWIPPGQRQALTRPEDVARFTANPVKVMGKGDYGPVLKLSVNPPLVASLPTPEPPDDSFAPPSRPQAASPASPPLGGKPSARASSKKTKPQPLNARVDIGELRLLVRFTEGMVKFYATQKRKLFPAEIGWVECAYSGEVTAVNASELAKAAWKNHFRESSDWRVPTVVYTSGRTGPMPTADQKSNQRNWRPER